MVERAEVRSSDCWNVEALYPSWEAWEKHYLEVTAGRLGPYFPQLGAFQSTLGKGAHQLKDCLDVFFDIDRSLGRLVTYAHLRHDEDVASDTPKRALMRATMLRYAFQEEVAWLEPEIVALPESVFTTYLQGEELRLYRFYLEKIVRLKAHTLSSELEALLALSGQATETAEKAFSSLNNADLKFPDVQDSQGNSRVLTHGTYQVYLKDPDRSVRKGAFENMHRTFGAFENTCAELLGGQIQKHCFHAKARRFSSCLEAALFQNEIDLSVYTSLIEAVRSRLHGMHQYFEIRKSFLQLEELHVYDLNVPLIDGVAFSVTYDEAVELILESLHVMGSDYVRILKQGLTEGRWVDRYENARKRSGAYSGGCYDSMPYILMNYQGTFNDLMTLTHEAGHSMHSYYTRHHQPYPYSWYGIFLAEVASTCHEALLLRHLLNKTQDPKRRAYLLTQQIDGLRSTLIRQTLFAEFELTIHQLAEKKVPLTPTLLKAEYRKLNATYLGSGVVLDPELDNEWARIPHFYYGFYVYQYATGISAAQVLAQNILSGDKKAQERYLMFLSAGGSRPPLEILHSAGVDMRSSTVVGQAMEYLGALVDELDLSLRSLCHR